MNNVGETIGYALIVAFLYMCWPPLALLGAGVLLVAWANVRAARAANTSGRTAAALGAAWGGARAAYRQARAAVELPQGPRRVA